MTQLRKVVEPFGEVNVHPAAGGKTRVTATILMEPHKEGAQTGLALDGSGSMAKLYGVGGEQPTFFESLLGFSQPKAHNDVTPVAQKLCSYLARKIDSDGGTKGWIFRFTIAGRTRDAGLGTYPTVTLIEARKEAERCRRLVAAGADPIQARNEERQRARLDAVNAITFEQCARSVISSLAPSWKSPRTTSRNSDPFTGISRKRRRDRP